MCFRIDSAATSLAVSDRGCPQIRNRSLNLCAYSKLPTAYAFPQCTLPILKLAERGGFEPPNVGIKTRCLAAWRHPNKLKLSLPLQ